MNNPLEQRLRQRLDERMAQNLYRRRPVINSPQQPDLVVDGKPMLNFCSNDYLGLAADERISQAVCDSLQQKAAGFGSGASHLVTGHHQFHHQLEAELAAFVGAERALLFSTGFMANIAVQQALLEKGDLILGDKLNHASLIDGGLASAAEFKRFGHLDYANLEQRLQAWRAKNPAGNCLLVSDSIFSMDGDLADLPRLAQIAERNQAWLLIDDAHGIGTLGEQGRGCFSDAGVQLAGNHILVGTFGKAFGTAGAFVAGSKTLIESLIQFARPYIFTTAMPPINALATLTALKIIQNGDDLREKLRSNIEMFKAGATAIGLDLMPSNSAIQPILLGESARAVKWSEELKQRGFWVAAIRPPTVPQNQARLRITLSAAHSQKQIERLLTALKEIKLAEN